MVFRGAVWLIPCAALLGVAAAPLAAPRPWELAPSPATQVASRQSDDWLIVPGERVGPVFAESTSQGLHEALGPENVVDRPIGSGDGEFEMGTLVYPDDPTLTLVILWHDVERRERPKRIIICYHTNPWSEVVESCRWRTAAGIRIGTRLSELEALNGGAFALTGFEWDFSGTVLSWNGGALEAALEARGWRAWIRVSPRADADGNWVPPMTYEEMQPVLGDHALRSTHPVVRKLDPSIYWIGFDIRDSRR